MVAIYAGIFLFLFFLLAPFIEGFLVSLKPLSQLFSSPYRFIPENASFAAYVTMWQSVPGFARYIFNSIFISSVATAIVLLVVVPAAYAFSRFDFKGAGLVLGGFLAVNMFSGAVLDHPALPADAQPRAPQHLRGDDRAGGGVPHPLGDLAPAHLHDPHPEGAARGRLHGRRQLSLHAAGG